MNAGVTIIELGPDFFFDKKLDPDWFKKMAVCMGHHQLKKALICEEKWITKFFFFFFLNNFFIWDKNKFR